MKKRTSELFIFLFTALAFSYFTNADAGTCSSISRSSFSANTILTSAELNSQFSTVYGAANDLDGGCITDGTLEPAALSASDFQPLFNNVVGGCIASYSSASSISISPCSATINGNIVYKNGSSIVSFGCSGCSAENSSTPYYVYIKGDSDGATINTLISTTAPDSFGYFGTHKVIARFYNNVSSDIDAYSIDQWHVNQFIPQETGRINAGTLTITGTTTDPVKGTIGHDVTYWSRRGQYAVIEVQYLDLSASSSGAGDYLFALPDGLEFKDTVFNTSGFPYGSGVTYSGFNLTTFLAGQFHVSTGRVIPYSSTTYRIMANGSITTSGPAVSAAAGKFVNSVNYSLFNAHTEYRGLFMVPIKNWSLY